MPKKFVLLLLAFLLVVTLVAVVFVRSQTAQVEDETFRNLAATFQANAALFKAAFGLRAATLARQIEDFAYDDAQATLREALAGMAPAGKS